MIAQTEHRRPPLYRVSRGQCRWCGRPTEPRLKKDGTPHGTQLNWHPACVIDHGIAANSTTAYGAIASRDGGRCVDCGAAPTYEPNQPAVVLEVDHQVPLWRVRDLPHEERREYFRLPNLKLRCVPCHKTKSAREAAERAAGGNQPVPEGNQALIDQNSAGRNRSRPPSKEHLMARKLKPGDGHATKNHNSANIKTAIKEVADIVIVLKAEKAEIQARITEAKSRIKGFGLKMADFNAALRLYELEAEDRDESIDNLKIAFEALGLGSQGDLFPEPAARGNGSKAPEPQLSA